MNADFITRIYGVRNIHTGFHAVAKHTIILDSFDMDQRKQRFSGVNTVVGQLKQEPMALLILKDNPGVVNLLDYYEDFVNAREMMLVMEEARGICLKEYIDRYGTLSPANFYAFMYYLIDTVSDMHQKGIIHRDLTYNNIFVDIDDKGTIKGVQLIDFGLVYKKGYGIRHKLALTPGFAPPESFRQILKKVEPAYDIYSIGVIMYYSLTGRFPYPDFILAGKEDESRYIEFDIKGITPEIQQFIRVCLKFDSRERPKSVSEIKREIYKGLKREGCYIGKGN
ncbi:MAG TPA: protein kinase [Candidatus Atribacteria bacterium]|nr:protein kinase [Candidatus Atribacteria bacterium]